MDITDYDKALYYTHHCACIDLSVLMMKTDDDILAKRIEKFVQAFIRETEFVKVKEARDHLLTYIDYVYQMEPVEDETAAISSTLD
ncbi:YhdB family protein [Guptibacillus algicola]|uniref:YhdB family protein n=1 Tax=Guptibacillus algicola TaxID=225844 RepID=UPI001CD32377|nr:YhdB family protein [Alkalihalobacillus algicola]MCA0988203.1 YhdB family protein [Alkalihalobacillus algicola]